MLDLEVGTCAVGEDPIAEELLATFLRMQGEGGYSTAEGSARVAELLAWARVLADGACALECVGSNMSPAFAEEMLDEWERALRVPNDAARTREQRQRRLVAMKAMTGLSSIPEITRIAAIAEVPVVPSSNTRALADFAAAEAETVFQGAAVLDEALWTNRGRSTLATILRRMLPAWRFGQHRRAHPEAMLMTSIGPSWGTTGALHTLGRTGLDAKASGALYMQRPVARVASYGYLSRLDAADLNRMQDNLLHAPCAAADNDALGVSLKESRVIFFSMLVPGSGAATLASGLDWRNRYVRVSAFWSATDIRPGQAGDTGIGAAASDSFLWATRTGVASKAIGASQVTLTSAATLITASNANVADRYLVGCLIISPALNSGTRTSRLFDFVDGEDMTRLSSAWWSSLLDASAPQPAQGAGVDTWTGYPTTARGAIHKAFVLATLTKPGAGANTYVVDTSIDWRDRLVMVFGAPAVASSADPIFPGVSGDSTYGTSAITGAICIFTGSGFTPGSAALSNYEYNLDDLRIGVRSSDGALIVQYRSGAVGSFGVLAAMVIAGDQMNVRGSATALNVPAAPASSVEAYQLNYPQDGGMYAQAEEASSGLAPVVSMPLGPITQGHTHTPIEWRESRRVGKLGDTLRPRRQPVAGKLRRYFACDIPTITELVLDTSQDWRDRIVHYSLARSASDIRPGGGNEGDINSGVAQLVTGATYTGKGGETYRFVLEDGGGPTKLRLYARASDGALCLANNMGATRYVVGMIEASFQLGPRSS